MVDEKQEQPVLIPVAKPLSLIPVGLKEAALDSPTFRASAAHFAEQIDGLEKWLDNYVKAATKLHNEVSVLEGLANSFLTSSNPPNQLSEAILDHDYTLLVLRRYGEGAREFWAHTFGGIKKAERSMLDPIKNFLATEVRAFKETRRILDTTQRQFDSLLAKYVGQSKTKEPSSLREDAFQLHEARKAYLKASMDYCVLTPQLRSTIDVLLIKVFSEQWLEMKDSRENTSELFAKHSSEIDRTRSWSQESSRGTKGLRRQLTAARKQIEDSAEQVNRPSRELDDYSISTVPFLGSSLSVNPTGSDTGKASTYAKQGWLFMRTYSGKPARTTWVRRWFFVKSGIFGWLSQGSRSGGVEESEKIGVLLCSVRPTFQEERRFCFEVKTKDTTIFLQAEFQQDLTEWISAFETAKQFALQDSTKTAASGNSGNPTADAAYAVSPAIAPELAARGADGQIVSVNDEAHAVERSATLAVGDIDVSRSSVDVLASGKFDRDGESSRDHATRILQKLDLHRKSTASPLLSGSSTPALGGSAGGGAISSLISSTHARPRMGAVTESWKAMLDSIPTTTLAPSTLVNPPSATNLSRTAVFVGETRGLDLGIVDTAGGVPSGLMANQWGSANYGYLSRLDRGEIEPAQTPPQATSNSSSNLSSPQKLTHGPFDGSNDDVRPLMSDNRSDSFPVTSSTSPQQIGHRKTVSQTQFINQMSRSPGSTVDLPSNYPAALRTQDAQCRILFPNVPQDERVVLVFRASWDPNEQQDLPGRVWVTPREILFYSHHQGLVMVSGIFLADITEVTITPGPGSDYLNLYVRDRDRKEDSSKIRIKTFLDPVKLLQKRLNYLVSNATSDHPHNLEGVIKELVQLESTGLERSASADSWEELSPQTAHNEPRRELDAIGLRVDQKLFTDAYDQKEPDVSRFKLPTQAVEYRPPAMDRMACEMSFDVSAKALFHIMFGDQSAVLQILYHGRRAQVLKQYPWTKDEHEVYNRNIEYEVDAANALHFSQTVTVVDSQSVDMANDHLCYVVTDRKTPWHLPYYRDFVLLSKIVITHTSKSKCKLAIFPQVRWSRKPLVFRALVERYAMEELDITALDLIEVVSGQVKRLGTNPPTRRAIQIFGHIGQHTDIAQINPSDLALPEFEGPIKRLKIRHRTLLDLIVETIVSFTRNAILIAFSGLLAILRALGSALTAHSLLVGLLIASLTTQLYWSSEAAASYWRDRSAATYMARLGVTPNTMLSKTVHLADIQPLFGAPSFDYSGTTHGKTYNSSSSSSSSSSTCRSAFHSFLESADLSSTRTSPSASQHHSPGAYPKSSNALPTRLRRTRQRLGAYRHDLLVAMRLINRMEREAVHAEWEGWVGAETRRCEVLEQTMSARAADGSDSHEHTNPKVESKSAEEVRAFFETYCASCRHELEAIGAASLV